MGYENIYFLHIPKTGGRTFYRNCLKSLEPLYTGNNIRVDVTLGVGTHRHQMWCHNYIFDTTYIVTLFRDPAEHAVSWYFQTSFLNNSEKAAEATKDLFFSWLAWHEEGLSNIQSKNLLIDLDTPVEALPWNLLKITSIDEAKLQQRLSRINLMLRTKDLSIKTTPDIRQKMLTDLGIPLPEFDTLLEDYPEHFNQYSTALYNSLTFEEKEYIYSLSPVDKAIYETDEYFYIPKKAL